MTPEGHRDLATPPGFMPLSAGAAAAGHERLVGYPGRADGPAVYGHLVPEASGRVRDALDQIFMQASMCPESAPVAR